MGHSAGAHIVMMLATDGRYLAAQQMSKRDLSGVIGLAGPYDFLPLKDATLEEIFPPALRAASQPINFVEGDEPPMFLAAGKRDTTVDPGNTDRFAARLRAAGDTVEVKHYPRIGHALLVGAFAGPLRGFAPVLDDTSAFIDAQIDAQMSREAQRDGDAQGRRACHCTLYCVTPSNCLRKVGARVDGSSQMPKNARAKAGSSNSPVIRSPA